MRDPNLHHDTLDDVDLNADKSLALSALTDGELTEDEWAALAQGLFPDVPDVSPQEARDTAAATWHRYHLIGDVMRAHPVQAGDVDARASIRFAQGVMMRLEQSPEPAAQAPHTAHLPHAPLSPPSVRPVPSHRPTSGAPAANDDWFRGRGLAIVASLALVGLAGWQFMPSEATLNPPVAPPLYKLSQSSQDTGAVSASASLPDTVAVETTQGVVIRDARLAAWMQTHRQHGGASALQAPAGFLRAATLDVPKP